MMPRPSTKMLIYRELNASMRRASGAVYPIEGYGHLMLTFQCRSAYFSQSLRDLAHVMSLVYHLLSLRVVADNGHTYTENH